jgi:hypothetical protein
MIIRFRSFILADPPTIRYRAPHRITTRGSKLRKLDKTQQRNSSQKGMR